MHSAKWMGASKNAAPTRAAVDRCLLLPRPPSRTGLGATRLKLAAQWLGPCRLGCLLALLAHHGAIGDRIVLLQHLHIMGWVGVGVGVGGGTVWG